jgi:hypothetical protein
MEDYAERTKPVSVTLDGVANDGAPGENDTVTHVENIFGGSAADTLVGNGQDNFLNGAEGNDTLRAQGGSDTLLGSEGADVVDGGDGTGDTALYVTANTGVSVSIGRTPACPCRSMAWSTQASPARATRSAPRWRTSPAATTTIG